ncbi:MAG: MerR family transcriptional regulator [Ginsengibacter sp.]
MALSQITFQFDDSQSEKNENVKKLVAGLENQKQKRGRKSLKTINAAPGLIDIPEDEILFKKQYYSIGDVATMFKENTSLIRYWENEFDILKPKKNKKGDRYFRPEDVKNLKMIYHLLRERKYTIEGAKEFLKNNKAAGEKHQVIESLEKIKLFLLELKANL